MKRYFQQNKPYLKKKQVIEVEEKNVKLRSILFLFFITIAIGAFVIAGASLSHADKGWTKITDTSSNINCGDDFSLQYNLGAGEMSATDEKKKLINVYNQLVEKAYQLFTTDEVYDHNIAYLNQNVNQEIEVDPYLYKSFQLLIENNNRLIYLGPIYQLYDCIFYAEFDPEARSYDGEYNSEIKEFYDEVLTYVHNNEIYLELLGDNKVKLNVSDEYLAFLKENDVNDYIDFYWLKNAFIIDYFAEELTNEGLTNAVISSNDGFARNLNNDNGEVNYTIYDLIDNTIYSPCQLSYQGTYSLISYRSFPITSGNNYYVYDNWDIVNRYLNYQNGQDDCCLDSMVVYSQKTCSELLLESYQAFCQKELDTSLIDEMKDNDIYTVYCLDKTIYHNGNGEISEVLDDDNIKYSLNEVAK